MHYYYIDVLRCVAAILITNSHYNNIWPIGALATGGSLGNTLFFAISGYCLSETKKVSFIEWMKKRLMRIYPPVLIVTFIEFVLLKHEVKTIKDIIKYFVYPTQFWFASAIILFYIFFYFITKYMDKYIHILMITTLCLYAFVYVTMLDISRWSIEGTGYFKWIYYFVIMLLGRRLKTNQEISKNDAAMWQLIVSVSLYFMFKIVLDLCPGLMPFQFISHIISGWFMIVAFKLGFFYENKINKFAGTKGYVVVSFISSLTFEIYLVQTFIIRRFENWAFPINFIVVTVMIGIEAFLLNRAIWIFQNIRTKHR